MTTAEYAEKLVALIEARPSRINLDKLLYEVYVKAKIAEARRDRVHGKWSPHNQVMEEMWQRINMKSDGHGQHSKTSKKS